MTSSKTYHLGLLYLTHLLISTDGVIDENEFVSLFRIKEKENIPDLTFKEFEGRIKNENDKEIYKTGIDLIRACSHEEKLKAFAHLYNLAEMDGKIHVKEVRLLLYSIKAAGVDFNEVVNHAKTQPN